MGVSRSSTKALEKQMLARLGGRDVVRSPPRLVKVVELDDVSGVRGLLCSQPCDHLAVRAESCSVPAMVKWVFPRHGSPASRPRRDDALKT